jgi:hypothetical protein
MGLEDFEKSLDRIVQRMLNGIGAAGAEAMRSNLEQDHGVNTERLVGGISFATASAVDRSKVNGLVKDTDLPEKPGNRNSVNIGTSNPYAPYVNYGALPHGQGNGSAEPEEGTFWEKVLAWAIEKWGDSPETRDKASAIGQAIAMNGTDAIPFFEPAFPVIRMAMRRATKEASASLGKEITPTVTTVDPDGNIKRDTKARGR